MAITFVSSVTQADTGTSSAINTTGASCIIIIQTVRGTISAPTDNKGNTYTQIGSTAVHPTTYDESVQVFRATGTPVVGTGHTFTTGSGDDPGLIVLAFAGTDILSPLDGSPVQLVNQPANGIPYQAGAITPTQDGDLIINAAGGFWGGVASSNINSGFTLLELSGAPAVNFACALSYLIQTTATSVNPTFTDGGVPFAARISLMNFAIKASDGTPVETHLVKVQSSPQTVLTNSSVPLTAFSTLPTVGNAIVVTAAIFIQWTPPPRCQDNRGNVYRLVGLENTEYGTSAVFCCSKIVSSAAPFTITISNAIPNWTVANAMEISGVLEGLVVEQIKTNKGTGTNPDTGLTPVHTVAEVFAVAVMNVIFGPTLSSITVESVTPAWTQETERIETSNTAAESDSRVLTGMTGLTTSCSWTLSVSANWSLTLVTFKALTTATAGRVTQDVVELLNRSVQPIRTTHLTIEALSLPAPTVRATQYVIEIISGDIAIIVSTETFQAFVIMP